MCQAVAYLSMKSIAHRDISPSNWMIGEEGRIVLIDFGVVWTANNPGEEGSTNLEYELGTGCYALHCAFSGH